MGFCLFNNVAVTAAALAARGERVLVVDYDAHHGNGTQDIFWSDERVAYASFHQYPLYPGSGGLREVGAGAGRGTTINLPLPAGATGDAYRAGVDEVLAPFAAAFEPTWLLISAGFDAHRADPITDLGLSAGDYADLTAALLELAPPGKRVVFLEGGYDLDALATSSAACVAALLGQRLVPEPVTSGGPGREAVTAAALGEGGAHGLRLKFAARPADVGQMTQLEELLAYLDEVQGSDLHLKPGAVPHVRVDGQLRAAPFEVPGPGVVEALAAGVLDSARQDDLAVDR